MLLLQKKKKRTRGRKSKLKVEKTQSRIDSLQEKNGSNLESETELNRLKQLKKNYQKDLDSKKKKWPCLKKKQKNKEKA